MKETNAAYKNIFKSTFLFGFMQIINILTKIGLNKAAAIFLGTEGIGLIGIYQSIIEMLKTFFGLGISQSAVRDVSKAYADDNRNKFSEIIVITKKLIWITALFGAIATIVLAPYLSVWSFGNENYIVIFGFISIVVLLNILLEGQIAILRGMRQLRSVAKATIMGSVAGLCAGVPLYYFFGIQGIVPSFIIISLIAAMFSWIYIRKIEYNKIKITLKESMTKSSHMIKMGLSLMFLSFIGLLHDYIIKVYVGNTAGLEMAGLYQAGLTIVSGYFGIFIIALMTDYYPRISAVHDDNIKLSKEMDKQSTVGLILVGPLMVLFILFMDFFIPLLYSDKFLPSTDYISYAVFGTIIVICSNTIDMILLAKQNSKYIIIATLIYRSIGIFVSLISFHYYGLKGLGVSMIIMSVIHMILMQGIMYWLYKIKFQLETISILFVTLLFATIAFYLNHLDSLSMKYGIGFILLMISFFYSIYNLNTVANINILSIVQRKRR